MNKRMLKLADKAGFSVENKRVFVDTFDDINNELDAYTKLVIKECLKAVERIRDDPFTQMAANHRFENISNTTVKDWMIAMANDIEREIKTVRKRKK